MGVLYDYFAAASDDEAAAVIDRVGGPGSQATIAEPEESKRGILGRRRRPAAPVVGTDPDLLVHDTVSVKGIDPVVQLGTLEELITGRPYDDVAQDPRSGHVVASRDGGERLVLTITDPLSSALATASHEDLERVAIPWSQTEEFWNAADPLELAAVLKDLAGLARRATESGKRLYCWVCV